MATPLSLSLVLRIYGHIDYVGELAVILVALLELDADHDLPKKLFALPSELFTVPEKLFTVREELFALPEELFTLPEELFTRPEKLFTRPKNFLLFQKNRRRSETRPLGRVDG